MLLPRMTAFLFSLFAKSRTLRILGRWLAKVVTKMALPSLSTPSKTSLSISRATLSEGVLISFGAYKHSQIHNNTWFSSSRNRL